MAETPQLTLALNCYKVERFVKEAVEGVFAQTFRPLEIVISDDHSPDGTWEKIVEAVMRLGGLAPSEEAPWQRPDFCGTTRLEPQADLTLVLNRNEKNLGLALHQNKLFELSSGEWIAFQAGDDVSVPHRMADIVKTLAENPRTRCLHSQVEIIDATGAKMEVPQKFQPHGRAKPLLPSILGAGAVYHRDVYCKFGPLGARATNEDHVLPLRAGILGDIVYVERPLVRYRKHDTNDSGAFSSNKKVAALYRLRIIPTIYQELSDIQLAEQTQMAPFAQLEKYKRLLEDKLYIQWFFGMFELFPERRLSLVYHLLASPSRCLLFLRHALLRLQGHFTRPMRIFSG